MKWTQKSIIKKIKDNKTKQIKEVKVYLPYQEDEVKNIYQIDGGVIPKACQKCKKEFISVPEEVPLEKEIPNYKCKNCDFEDITAQKALEHKLLKENHKIKVIKKKQIVDIQRKILGIKANIKILNDDVIILCDGCK